MSAKDIFEFEEKEALITWLEDNLKSTDTVLLKGSRGLRMDHITAALEAEK
jgi:UDP-N-acetylmuramoyl-tripeptide--D-alanyl-D-alanine ligase